MYKTDTAEHKFVMFVISRKRTWVLHALRVLTIIIINYKKYIEMRSLVYFKLFIWEIKHDYYTQQINNFILWPLLNWKVFYFHLRLYIIKKMQKCTANLNYVQFKLHRWQLHNTRYAYALKSDCKIRILC